MPLLTATSASLEERNLIILLNTGRIPTRQGDKRSNHESQNTDAQGTRAPQPLYMCFVDFKKAFDSHKLAFSTAILTFFVFLLPISIRFHYLDHLVANRMAPSICLNSCGTRWGSWFQAVLYHISAAYLVFMQFCIFF